MTEEKLEEKELVYDIWYEEPNCLKCIHITDSNFDCTKYCGAKNGWKSYIN